MLKSAASFHHSRIRGLALVLSKAILLLIVSVDVKNWAFVGVQDFYKYSPIRTLFEVLFLHKVSETLNFFVAVLYRIHKILHVTRARLIHREISIAEDHLKKLAPGVDNIPKFSLLE